MNKLYLYPFLVSILTGSVIGVSGCSSGDEATVTTGGNTAPIAVAGDDKNVVTGVVVQLDGSSSSDSDGDALSYQWALQSKPANSLSFLSTLTEVDPSFIPDFDGSYTISLVVNDGTVDSIADIVTYTASETANNAPVANAGADQAVFTGATVILDGSASFDPDGDTFTYAWTLQSQPSTSTTALFSSTLFNPSFVADVDGSYTISLVVNDGIVDSSADTVVVTASTTGPTGSIAAGKIKYDADCESCHAAGTYDPVAVGDKASDLYGDGNRLVTNLSSIAGMKNVPDITPQELLDLKAFIDDPATNQ